MDALLTAHPALWAAVAFVGAATGALRAWLAHRTAVRREEEHTRRVELAVSDTAGPDRAAVVRASAQLAPSAPRGRVG
ncbi:hypothetical protein [Streptomyces avicenniae]|uniref:hypothetical protein n=1 Tax=Streptomyces avicenniae TaxID=500153 RepID=UPI00069AC976|nr:hypothetical protein [Streptomyces avicenniae]